MARKQSCFDVMGDAITRKAGRNLILEVDDIININPADAPIFVAQKMKDMTKNSSEVLELVKNGFMMSFLKEEALKRRGIKSDR